MTILLSKSYSTHISFCYSVLMHLVCGVFPDAACYDYQACLKKKIWWNIYYIFAHFFCANSSDDYLMLSFCWNSNVLFMLWLFCTFSMNRGTYTNLFLTYCMNILSPTITAEALCSYKLRLILRAISFMQIFTFETKKIKEVVKNWYNFSSQG